MNCPVCGQPVAFHWTRCCHGSCNADLGFPNVRAATAPEEREHLDAHYREAYATAQSNGSAERLHEFEEQTASTSRAVICRPLGTLGSFVRSRHGPFQTFYQQVTRGRVPENNAFDSVRGAIDFLFFPYYGERIHFAAMSLDGTGSTSYGANQPICHLVLRADTIAPRASLFRENTLLYCDRMKHPVGQPIPVSGWRAAWDHRQRLAVAKCGQEISATTQPTDFAGVLLRSGATTADDVFIEVHIHDPLTAGDVERARLPRVSSDADQVLVEVVATYFNAAGATCEEVL